MRIIYNKKDKSVFIDAKDEYLKRKIEYHLFMQAIKKLKEPCYFHEFMFNKKLPQQQKDALITFRKYNTINQRG